MPEDLAKEYKRAKFFSRVGSIIMYFVAALMASVFVVYLYAVAQTNSLDQLGTGRNVLLLIGTAFPSLSFALLAEFLRHFSNDASPFGPHQSKRLLLSGALLGFIYVLKAVFPLPSFDIALIDGPIPLSLTSQPGPSLETLVMVVFLLCLAMVVRYGDALKVDSDSFG